MHPLVERVRGEYLEMPGLRLTEAQAARLCGIEPATCRLVLDRLTADRFLVRKEDGTYMRLTAGPFDPAGCAPIAIGRNPARLAALTR